MRQISNEIYSDLNRLQRGLKAWDPKDLDKLLLSSGTKEIPVYIGQQNKHYVLPTKKDIAKATGCCRASVDKRIDRLKDLDLVLEVTLPEMVRFLGIERKRGIWEYMLPKDLKWFGKYLNGNYMEFTRKSGSTHSIEKKKENFSSPIYERHYISNLLDESGEPYYLPLNLHVKR